MEYFELITITIHLMKGFNFTYHEEKIIFMAEK